MRQFSSDDVQADLQSALDGTFRGQADIGEVLATAVRIKEGDADAWVAEWRALADRIAGEADAAWDAGHRVSALAHYRRAATYYATALGQVDRSHHPERRLEIWRRSRCCWERIIDLSGGERTAIAYERVMMPGWFFRAPDAEPGERRPTVVVANGGERGTPAAWGHGGAAAHERGWHWMTFDGPGQQSMLYEQGIPLRPDWEAVLTPVVDALHQRPDVDPNAIGLLGIGEAADRIAHALTREHRFAAAVVDPGAGGVPHLTTPLLVADHCSGDEGIGVRGPRIFDWLDARLSADRVLVA